MLFATIVNRDNFIFVFPKKKKRAMFKLMMAFACLTNDLIFTFPKLSLINGEAIFLILPEIVVYDIKKFGLI